MRDSAHLTQALPGVSGKSAGVAVGYTGVIAAKSITWEYTGDPQANIFNIRAGVRGHTLPSPEAVLHGH